MEEQQGTLEQLASNLGDFFDPFTEIFDEEVTPEAERNEAVRRLLAELGLLLPPEAEQLADLVENPKEAYEENILPILNDIKSFSNISLDQAFSLFDKGKGIFEAIVAIKDDIEGIIDALNLDDGGALKDQWLGFAQGLPEKLPYFLLIKYMEKNGRAILPVLVFVGFVEIEEKRADAYEKEGEQMVDENFVYFSRHLNWDNLFDFFKDPTKKIEELF